MGIYGNLYFDNNITVTQENYNEIINEAYVGKTKEALELQRLVSVCRKEAGNNAFTSPITTNSECITKLSDHIEKMFGIETFAIQPIYQNIINAYTVPIGNRIDLDKSKLKGFVKLSSTGIKYSKDAHIHVYMMINLGLFTNKNYTDGEATAIILHEIGHNFQECVYTNNVINNIYPFLNPILDIIDILNNNKLISKMEDAISKLEIQKENNAIMIQTALYFLINNTQVMNYISNLTKFGLDNISESINRFFNICGEISNNLSFLLGIPSLFGKKNN